MIFVTVPSLEVGESIARAVVKSRAAACGNLLGPVRSYYHFEGEYEEASEYTLLLKTPQAKVDELVTQLLELHPYQVPAIEVLQVDHTTPAAWAWLLRETS